MLETTQFPLALSHLENEINQNIQIAKHSS